MSTPEIVERFRQFGATVSKAPLYERLSTLVVEQPSLAAPLREAPATQQLPVLFFAAVHCLLLSDPSQPLASHYPNIATGSSASNPLEADFTEFCTTNAGAIAQLVRTRNTQTNEVGRCAVFLPALAMVADEVGNLAHIDVGTSAGLNLLLPRLGYQYSPGGVVQPDAPLTLHCGTKGNVPVPSSMPNVTASIGVDMAPINLDDPLEVRWLESCVWPDQIERFHRLVQAIELARSARLDVRTGDAVDSLEQLVTEASRKGHPVVTNSWVLNYLTPERRLDYVATLDDLGSTRDLSWVIAEAPAQTEGLPWPQRDPSEEITVVALVRWRRGQRTVQRLGSAHPHGAWLRWES